MSDIPVMTLAVALLAEAAVFVHIDAAFKLAHGEYAGLKDMSGWNLYSRVAPSCRLQGVLLHRRGRRSYARRRRIRISPGHCGYVCGLRTRSHDAILLFSPTISLRAFARQVVLHKTGAHPEGVGIDLLRYLEPSIATSQRLSPGRHGRFLHLPWRESRRFSNDWESQALADTISRSPQ